MPLLRALPAKVRERFVSFAHAPLTRNFSSFDEAYSTVNSLVTYRSSLDFPDAMNGTQTGGRGNVTVVPASSASRDILYPVGIIKRDVRHSLLVCVVVGLLWWRFS